LISLVAWAEALCVENDRRGKQFLRQIGGSSLVLRFQVQLWAGMICADRACSNTAGAAQAVKGTP
jgi:hypothetical protein